MSAKPNLRAVRPADLGAAAVDAFASSIRASWRKNPVIFVTEVVSAS